MQVHASPMEITSVRLNDGENDPFIVVVLEGGISLYLDADEAADLAARITEALATVS